MALTFLRPSAERSAQTWDNRVNSWEHQVHDTPGLSAVHEAVLEQAHAHPGERCVDLGAGTGALAHPLSSAGVEVLAIDVSSAMLDRLAEQSEAPVRTMVADLASLDLPDGSADLIVSSYALHHLEHPDKRALLGRCARWLAPGGRLVVADMMFGRGTSAGDLRIVANKVRALAVRGPAGWWRIARNLGRFGLGVGAERPAAPEQWVQWAAEAGLEDVQFTRVVAEAGVVTARRPPA